MTHQPTKHFPIWVSTEENPKLLIIQSEPVFHVYARLNGRTVMEIDASSAFVNNLDLTLWAEELATAFSTVDHKRRLGGGILAAELKKADPIPTGWFWFVEQQEPVKIGRDRQFYDAIGERQVVSPGSILIPLPNTEGEAL